MRVLPIELLFEIEKFIRSKNETLVMYSLTSNYTEIKFNKLKISYICTSLKLLKWYSKYFQLNEKVFKCTALYAIIESNLTNLKWLHENNCPWDWFPLDTAEKYYVGSDVKGWLKKNLKKN